MYRYKFLELLTKIGDYEKELLNISIKHRCLDDKPLFFTSDSRKVKENSVYIAIKGLNENGHDYVNESFQKGAIISVIEEFGDFEGPCIKVDSTIDFINELASMHYRDCSPYTIAITGSNGKTTTKEWVRNLLGEFIPNSTIFSNVGNMNTEIGLPLCILNDMNESIAFSILEMGMSERGDIGYLVDKYKPDFPVILNIGSAHIGNTGSLENTLLAKAEIFKSRKENGLYAINSSDLLLREYAQKHMSLKSAVLFGKAEDAIEGTTGVFLKGFEYAFEEEIHSTSLKLLVKGVSGEKEMKIKLNWLLHEGQILNLCAALAILHGLGKDLFSIQDFNSLINPIHERFEIVYKLNHLIIKDCYNSSLESLGFALEVLKSLKKSGDYEKLCCILGSIAETGNYNTQTHEKLGDMLNQATVETAYLYTKDDDIVRLKKVYKGEVYLSNNIDDIGKMIINEMRTQKKGLFLFKASRSIKLEEVYDYVMDAVD